MNLSDPAGASVRVLIVAPAPLVDPRSGGIASFIRSFVEFMPADFEVEICGAAVGDEAPLGKWHEIEVAGRRVRFLAVAGLPGARRRGRVPAKARIVAGMLRFRRQVAPRGRVAQVHAPAMAVGLVGRRMPLVRVVHNSPEDLASNPGESLWGRFRWLIGPLERRSFRGSEVFFVNRDSRDEYAARMPDHAARLHYLPLAIDGELFRMGAVDERERLRGQLSETHQIPLDAQWLLFAGRLDQQKDPLLAVRAFAELAGDEVNPASHLVVAGDGRLRAAAESVALELGLAGRVHFLGALPRPALATVMRAADALLLSSEFEAGPFVVLEALASGLPVAATRVGEVPRYVSHGETGWIVDEHTPLALADAARWALAQPRAVVAPRAAASVADHDVRSALQPFYEAHRRLARAAAVSGPAAD